jgi:hypothetical protein
LSSAGGGGFFVVMVKWEHAWRVLVKPNVEPDVAFG